MKKTQSKSKIKKALPVKAAKNNLIEKAILASLIITQWTARKFDRKVTTEVNEQHGAVDAGRFNKLLISSAHLKEINSVVSEARQFHYDNTLPWSDEGARLLPSKNYFEYTAKISKLKDRYEAAVAKFVKQYPAFVEQAKHDLNGLFDEKDYPTSIEDRFALRTSFTPVPDVNDLRVNLNASEVDKLKKGMAVEITDRFRNAQKNIFTRVIEQLKYMHARLKDTDTIFRDTLFTHVLELVDLLPKLNVAENPQIDELCSDLRQLYTEPDNVRKSVHTRKQKVKDIEAIMSKVSAFMG